MKYSSQFTVLSFLFQDLSLELFSYSVVQFSLGFAALAQDFRACLTPTALGLRFAKSVEVSNAWLPASLRCAKNVTAFGNRLRCARSGLSCLSYANLFGAALRQKRHSLRHQALLCSP
jgi:hypothetical protein